jgi:glycosyltransferase involved in cell wall biosynthesis
MHDPTELVSIVMPTCGRLHYLRVAVASVFAQTWPHWELLITDDGSDEPTRAYLRSLCSDPRVSVDFLPHCGFPSRVRNAALRRASGAYVAFLDSDDSWLPDKLTKQVALMRLSPQCRWSYTAFVGVDGTDVPLTGEHKHRWVALSGAILPDLLTGRATVRIGTLLCTRELLAEVGHFDELIESGEDYELYMRLSLVSDVALLDEELLLFRRHEANLSSRLRAPYADRQYVLAKLLRRADSRWHSDIRRERARSHVVHVHELLARGATGAALRVASGSTPQGWSHLCWWRGLAGRLLRAALRTLTR